MRPSLENIEFIENYILGNFDPSEQEIAKKHIEGSPELSSLLETQQCIYSATKRKALRSEIQSYAPTAGPSFFQQYRNWFIGGLTVLSIVACFIIFNSNDSLKKHQSTELFQAQVLKNEQDVVPWIPFDVQFFDLIAEKGGTIVGKDGTLILLASNSLLDAQGNSVSGKVQAELIEALDWEDMIAYNLTTTSDGKALSSGGMFRIRYKQNGKEVFVDPEKPMYIEIPTDDYNPAMKVWEGEVKDDQLNWKNPQEIKNYLSKISLKQLDFIPHGFDQEVSALLPYKQHKKLSDYLVDSLYYSISASQEMYDVDDGSKNSFVNDCYFDIPVRNDVQRRGGKPFQSKPQMQGVNSITGQIVGPEGNPIAGVDVKLRMDRFLEHKEIITTDDEGKFTYDKLFPGEVAIYASLHSSDNDEILWKYCLETSFICPKNPKNFILKEPLVAEYSSMINFKELSDSPKTGGCFIDPIAIKTLKGKRFQNTFIATAEFETRLQIMHQLRNGSLLLETYVNNLSKPLWKCDQMAADLLSGEEKEIFQDFADQKLTNVENDGIHQEALTAYYTEQRKTYRAEKRKRYLENREKTSRELLDLSQSLETVLNKPAELAALQVESKGRTDIGSATMTRTSSKRARDGRVIGRGSYKFTWYSSSWCNIDRFLLELGPTPFVTAVSTNIEDKGMKVYQCVRRLKNVIGLVNESGSYKAVTSRNGNQGETFCIAMSTKGGHLLFDAQSYFPSSDRNLDLNLEPTSQEDFYLELCSLAPLESSVAKRLRAEQNTLKAQAKIKQTLKPFALKLESAKNEISSEVIVYNRLFDFLNGCSKNLVQ